MTQGERWYRSSWEVSELGFASEVVRAITT